MVRETGLEPVRPLQAAGFKPAMATITSLSQKLVEKEGIEPTCPKATTLQAAVLPLEHLLRLKNNYTRLGKVWQI